MIIMSHECDFFSGVSGVKCKRIEALRVARANIGCDRGEFIEIARIMCREESDSERANDCPAFRDLQKFGSSSDFAERLPR